MLTIEQLYDLNHTLAADYLRQFTYPWEALAGIKAEILRIGAALDPAEYTEISEHVWVHKTATGCADGVSGCALHHRRADGSAALRVHPRQCAGRGRLRGRQLCGAEERDSFRPCADAALQLRRRQHPRLLQPHGGGVDYQQREERQDAGDGSRAQAKAWQPA